MRTVLLELDQLIQEFTGKDWMRTMWNLRKYAKSLTAMDRTILRTMHNIRDAISLQSLKAQLTPPPKRHFRLDEAIDARVKAIARDKGVWEDGVVDAIRNDVVELAELAVRAGLTVEDLRPANSSDLIVVDAGQHGRSAEGPGGRSQDAGSPRPAGSRRKRRHELPGDMSGQPGRGRIPQRTPDGDAYCWPGAHTRELMARRVEKQRIDLARKREVRSQQVQYDRQQEQAMRIKHAAQRRLERGSAAAARRQALEQEKLKRHAMRGERQWRAEFVAAKKADETVRIAAEREKEHRRAEQAREVQHKNRDQVLARRTQAAAIKRGHIDEAEERRRAALRYREELAASLKGLKDERMLRVREVHSRRKDEVARARRSREHHFEQRAAAARAQRVEGAEELAEHRCIQQAQMARVKEQMGEARARRSEIALARAKIGSCEQGIRDAEARLADSEERLRQLVEAQSARGLFRWIYRVAFQNSERVTARIEAQRLAVNFRRGELAEAEEALRGAKAFKMDALATYRATNRRLFGVESHAPSFHFPPLPERLQPGPQHALAPTPEDPQMGVPMEEFKSSEGPGVVGSDLNPTGGASAGFDGSALWSSRGPVPPLPPRSSDQTAAAAAAAGVAEQQEAPQEPEGLGEREVAREEQQRHQLQGAASPDADPSKRDGLPSASAPRQRPRRTETGRAASGSPRGRMGTPI